MRGEEGRRSEEVPQGSARTVSGYVGVRGTDDYVGKLPLPPFPRSLPLNHDRFASKQITVDTSRMHNRAVLYYSLDVFPGWLDLAISAAAQNQRGQGPLATAGFSLIDLKLCVIAGLVKCVAC